MADIKTNLRELSVAVTVGLLKNGVDLKSSDLYDTKYFIDCVKNLVCGELVDNKDIIGQEPFTKELRQIIDNGYSLGEEIFQNEYFDIKYDDPITWQGNDTQKEDPIDITIGKYGFSLKEESFILENMGLYKLLNCYTGSNYSKKRHIFNDYARKEYELWFSATWSELLIILSENNTWSYYDSKKNKKAIIVFDGKFVKLEYYEDSKLIASSELSAECDLSEFERKTTSKTREQVFSRFINQNLRNSENYNITKRNCAIVAVNALVKELNENLNYDSGLPRFLRIHKYEYYYAKTTSHGIQIFKVPSMDAFGDEIIIESIESYVPDKQANILTTIKNKKTGQKLVLRNECRFSHGQFNGTPEAKMYYEYGGSLEVIYEKI